jgi:hypothetical protein
VEHHCLLDIYLVLPLLVGHYESDFDLGTMMSRSAPDDSASPFFGLHMEERTKKPTLSQAFVIGVCGGTASGKTTVCKAILDQLSMSLSGMGRVIIISQDSYYRGLSKEENDHVEDYNFDCPAAFDWQLIEQHLSLLKSKKPIDLPHYDFVTHQVSLCIVVCVFCLCWWFLMLQIVFLFFSKRTQETTHIYGADVILFEGNKIDVANL